MLPPRLCPGRLRYSFRNSLSLVVRGLDSGTQVLGEIQPRCIFHGRMR